MSFEPDPRQTLYMLRLVFGPAEPKLKDLKPPLEPAPLRKQLEALGLIRLEKRGRYQHVLLTDKGWQWTEAHLNARINPAGASAGRVLVDLLPRLQAFLARKGHALAELFSDGSPTPPLRSQHPSTQAQAALLGLGHGQTQQRLTLAQVRAALPQLSRAALDAALLDLQHVGAIALYHEDDPELRGTEIEAAALQLGGSRYHLVYLLRQEGIDQ